MVSRKCSRGEMGGIVLVVVVAVINRWVYGVRMVVVRSKTGHFPSLFTMFSHVRMYSRRDRG